MYEAHFGLSQLPFRLAPDASFHVDAAPHRAAITAMLDQLRDDEAFIPLIGEFGVGKTTIARQLLAQVRDGRHLVGELPGVRIDGDDLYARVTEAFGLGDASAAASGERLVQQLSALARAGRDALLVVDDAHRLEADALTRLRLLTAVRVDGRAALHVALVGRSLPVGIEDLRRAGQPLHIGAPVRVEPLDAAGTRTYVLERLALAGWTGRPAFSPDTTAEIHACCNGNPGRINRLCGHVLLQLYMAGRDDLGPRIVRAVDAMLRSELDGEPAPATLPPAEPATPPAVRVGHSAFTMLVDRPADIVPTFTLPAPSHLPAPLRPAAVITMEPTARMHRPSRQLLAQGVAAVALLVGGGWLWQTISSFATARSQARFAAAAATAAVAATAQATTPRVAAPVAHPAAPVAPLPTRSTSEETLALAEQAIARAPPGAGGPPSSAQPAATQPATLAEPQRVPPDASGHQHATPAHKARARSLMAAAATPAAACTLESEALGLCSRARARAPAPAPAALARPVAPARDAPPESVRPAPAPPACDPNRAVLALCPEGSRTAP
jgi:type II secretory pathway predicted ATPase ExeA